MGPDYVRSMCHDIEDPTFDATAVASNPRAQVRPIHRPPRSPGPRRDQHPHCAWTVIIDESHPEVAADPGAGRRRRPPAPPLVTRPDRPDGRGAGRLRRAARLRPRLRGVLALGAGAHRRRGLPPDAPAQPRLPARGARPRRRPRSRRRRSPPSSWSASPASPPSGSTARSAPTPSRRSRCTRCSTRRRTSTRRSRTPRVTVSAAARPRGRRLDHACAAPTRCGRSRPRSAPSTRTSTSRSPGRRADWTATVVRRDEPARRLRRGRGDPVQHRRRVRVRAAQVAADHAGLSGPHIALVLKTPSSSGIDTWHGCWAASCRSKKSRA